jgi:[calcium/calmodulin-dependent protein kinase] kinase
MKAITKFKGLIAPKAVSPPSGEEKPVAAVEEEKREETPDVAKSPEGPAKPESSAAEYASRLLREREQFLKTRGAVRPPNLAGEKAQPQRPSEAEPVRLLGIGIGGGDDFAVEESPEDIVSDSPTAVDFNVYDRAFEAEVDRIKRSSSRKGSRKGSGAMYHTKHLSEKDQYKTDETLVWMSSTNNTPRVPNLRQGSGRFADFVVHAMKENQDDPTKTQE